MKIEKTPSGHYRVRIFLGRDARGKQKFKSITGRTRADVRIALSEYLRDAEEKDPSSEGFTVGSAVEKYIEDRRSVLSPTTVTGYKTILNKYLYPLRDVRIKDVKASDVQKLVNGIASSHSPKTVRNASALLASVIREHRPSFRFTPLLPQKKKTEMRIPTKEEYEATLSFLEGPSAAAVTLAACAGLRQGEILGLYWDKIDIKKRTIRVDSSLAFDESRKRILKAPKTTESTRTIKMTPAVYDMLAKEKK